MYQLDFVQQRVRRASAPATTVASRPAVSRTVWYLGFTSCLTDISSEMVNGILPIYLVAFLRLSPLQFGVIDGLYQGVSAVLRLVGGVLADRFQRHKATAVAGYALSAFCKLGLLATGASWTAVAGVIAIDRTGKGLRTAPRDAMITLASDKTTIGTSFGVHRALDAGGALLGPVLAFMILAYSPNAFDLIFVVSFCVAVVGLGVLVLLVEPASSATPDRARAAVPLALSALPAALRGSGFGYLVVAASVLGLATMSDAFIYLTLQQRLAFSPGVFPLLYVATSLVYMMAAVPAGRLADRVGRRQVFVGGYVMMGAVYTLLLFPSTGMAGAGAAIIGLGLYYAATDGVLMAIAGRLLPASACATGLAFLTTCTSIARLTSSVAFGWVWTTGDVRGAVQLFGAALVVALIVAVVALRRIDEGAPCRA